MKPLILVFVCLTLAPHGLDHAAFDADPERCLPQIRRDTDTGLLIRCKPCCAPDEACLLIEDRSMEDRSSVLTDKPTPTPQVRWMLFVPRSADSWRRMCSRPGNVR